MRCRTILLCLVLGACTTTNSGDKVQTSSVKSIRPGVSKQAVEQSLGQPTQRTAQANGDELWIYDYSQIQSDHTAKMVGFSGLYTAGAIATAFIPGAGLAMGAAGLGMAGIAASGSKAEAERQTVTIAFKKGIVKSCLFTKLKVTSSASGGLVFTLPTVSSKTDSSEIHCTDIPDSPPPTQTPATVASTTDSPS